MTTFKKNPAVVYLSNLGSRNSAVTLGNCLNRIAYVLNKTTYENADWSKMRRSHWQKIQNDLRKRGCSGATINLYLTAFKAVAKEAWSLDILPQAFYLKIESLKSIRYERLPKGRSLNTNECRQLLKSCADGTTQGLRDSAMFACMFGCGLRRAEIVSLQMSNWDCLKRSFVFVGKGNKERRVFLPKDLDEIIDDWLARRGIEEGVFFPRIRPGANKDSFVFRSMLPSSIYRILQKRAESAGLGKLKPHDLRRTFATRMLEAGCDVFLLQKAMGHSSVNTTARYDYRGDSYREAACKSLRF